MGSSLWVVVLIGLLLTGPAAAAFPRAGWGAAGGSVLESEGQLELVDADSLDIVNPWASSYGEGRSLLQAYGTCDVGSPAGAQTCKEDNILNFPAANAACWACANTVPPNPPNGVCELRTGLSCEIESITGTCDSSGICVSNSQSVGTINVPVNPGLTCASWPQRPNLQPRRSYRRALRLINQAIYGACGMPERAYIPFIQPNCVPADLSGPATSINVIYQTRIFRNAGFQAQYVATLNSLLASGAYECLVTQELNAIPDNPDSPIKQNAMLWLPTTAKPQPCLPDPVVCVVPTGAR